MRHLYPPERTQHWTDGDLKALIGKYVVVSVPASGEFRRNHPDAKYEGGSGICEEAGIGRFDNAFVVWDYGMGWDWNRSAGAWVGVCDEHDDHTSPNGSDCAMTLDPPDA